MTTFTTTTDRLRTRRSSLALAGAGTIDAQPPRLPQLPKIEVSAASARFAVKHTVGWLLAFAAVIVLLPLLAAIAAAVKTSSKGPVLYRQRRVGRDGETFDILKFRSMGPAPADASAFKTAEGSAPGGVEGVDRRTKVGKVLRRTSLDELPQLFNVLKGEMALVGPRPERPEFVEQFTGEIDRYADRHRVKVGITGWAQVNGLRGQTSIADRADADNWYIDNHSLWLDVKTLALTARAVCQAAE